MGAPIDANGDTSELVMIGFCSHEEVLYCLVGDVVSQDMIYLVVETIIVYVCPKAPKVESDDHVPSHPLTEALLLDGLPSSHPVKLACVRLEISIFDQKLMCIWNWKNIWLISSSALSQLL